jgi:Fe(3+) dicitrate transport protein
MRRFEISVLHEQRFTARLKLRTLVYAYDNTRLWRRQAFDRDPASGVEYERVIGDPSVPRSAIWFRENNAIQRWLFQVAGVEPRMEARFATASVEHTLDIGARLLGEAAHYAEATAATPTADTGAIQNVQDHSTVALAGYVQDRIALKDDLLLTPGLRVEHAGYHQLVTRQSDATGVHDVHLPGDKDVTGFIPGIGTVYGTKRANGFVGVHYGWAPPRIADSFGPNGNPVPVSAEESVNYEIGARVAPTKWVRGEAAGFLSTFTNQVVAASTQNGATLVDGGPTRHVGVEAAATFGVGRALKWPLAVDVGARYTFARATFTEGAYAGRFVPYAPLHTAGANVDVEHPSGFGGQIAYYHVSSQFSDFANTVAENATGEYGLVPAYDIVDVTAHYRHRPSGLSARVSVKNLLDSNYIATRRPQGIDVGGFRQIVVGLRWEYDATKTP